MDITERARLVKMAHGKLNDIKGTNEPKESGERLKIFF
jgi:hypothetical protein